MATGYADAKTKLTALLTSATEVRNAVAMAVGSQAAE
jgi:hypothetical protein